MAQIDLAVEGDIPQAEVEEARERIAGLLRYVEGDPEGLRLTIRRGGGSADDRDYVADASVLFQGRALAAHAVGRTPAAAAAEAAERLRRQMRRVIDADVAMRNEPRAIERAIEDITHERRHRPRARVKPPEKRDIVHRATYGDFPKSTRVAVMDLLDLDLEFLLFRHERTGEDVVVYRRDDGRIGLLHPQGSELADENDIVVPEASRYPGPLALSAAQAEMDALDHRFLYFIDEDDGRGKVLYLRHDGDYGLVEPARAESA